MNLKVSIIVAIYKSELFLKKLLDSIIAQTYKDIEVILIDDGSPDNSGKICDEYVKKDNRFIVIHKSNEGACEARNIGLEKATGEYITIIDGDDWLEPDYIEYLFYIAISNKADMSLTDKIFTTRDRIQTKNDKIEVWSSEKTATSIIYPIIPIGPWNKLYKLEMIKKHNLSFSVPWSGEGLYFSFMAAQYSNYVAVGHKKIYNYRLNNTESGLTNYNVQMGLNALWNIKNLKNNNFLNSRNIDNAINWHIWKNHHFLLKLLLATNLKEKYKKEYNDCLTGIWKNFCKILIFSELTFKYKLKMIIINFFPKTYALYQIKKEKKDLLSDKYI